ncbi:hypothetical protein LOK49_Contig78G00005 [Camellia lanceoleosa]|nr:hypothetical protein LOK49_Contig78G00005 [Camellia lanceoleosa]
MDFKNEVERNKMKKPSEAYLEWNRRVMKIEEEVEELVANYKKSIKRFRFSSRSGFKETMKKMYKRVINLRDESDQIREKILVNRPPETVVNMRAPDIKKFETLQKSLEQILDLLKGKKFLSFLMAETIAIVGAAAGVMQAVSQAKPIFWDPLMTKVNLSENVEEIHYYLNDAVNNLVSVKMDFRNEVERNKMKKPSEAYLEWNRRVMKIEE